MASLIDQAEAALARLLLVPGSSTDELERIFRATMAKEFAIVGSPSGRIYAGYAVFDIAMSPSRCGEGKPDCARWRVLREQWIPAWQAAERAVLDWVAILDRRGEEGPTYGSED